MKRTALQRRGRSRKARRPLAQVSPRHARPKAADDPVYLDVDRRSGGWCEADEGGPRHRATEHHHLFKPRRSNHAAPRILHLCARHHAECSRAYHLGRRVHAWFDTELGRWRTTVVTAADKFAARRGHLGDTPR